VDVQATVAHEFHFLGSVDEILETIWLLSGFLLPLFVLFEFLESFLKTAILTGEFIYDGFYF